MQASDCESKKSAQKEQKKNPEKIRTLDLRLYAKFKGNQKLKRKVKFIEQTRYTYRWICKQSLNVQSDDSSVQTVD